MSDITAGIIAAMGACAAYSHKLQTGQGQRVDTSLFEAAIVHTYWQSAIALATGDSPTAMGSAHPLNAPYQAFRTSDGWINVGAANQRNWEKFAELIGAPQLASDPRFLTNAERMANRLELEGELNEILKTRSTAEWLDIFDRGGLPAGPVLTINEMHQDPQTLAREMLVDVQHARAGTVRTIGLPVKFSDTPGGVETGAPVLGQHTREVLAEAGFTEDEIEAVVAATPAQAS